MLIEFYRHEYDEKRLFVYILVFMIFERAFVYKTQHDQIACRHN